MTAEAYKPGNPFLDRVSIADAAVGWQRLSADQQALVVVEEGLPYLAGVPELRQRAEALLDAAQRGKLAGLTHNEDGYPLPATAVRLDRAAVAKFIKQVDATVAATKAAPAQVDDLLRFEDVCRALGVGRSTTYRMQKDGRLAPPHLENPPRWRKSYIDSLSRGSSSED